MDRITIEDVRAAYDSTGYLPLAGADHEIDGGKVYADPVVALVARTPHAAEHMRLVLGASEWQERADLHLLEIRALGMPLDDYLDGFGAGWHGSRAGGRRHPSFDRGRRDGESVRRKLEAERTVFEFSRAAGAIR